MKPKYWAVIIFTALTIIVICLYYWQNNNNFINSVNYKYPPNYSFDQLLLMDVKGKITMSTAQLVAKFVGGSVTQCIEDAGLCEIQVPAQNDSELNVIIGKIKSNPNFSNIKVSHNIKVSY